jgi:hypothetical protein
MTNAIPVADPEGGAGKAALTIKHAGWLVR